MARFDSLNLRPNEGPGRQTEDALQRREDFLAQAAVLLDDDRYSFAWDTVQGMHDSVKLKGQEPTARMQQALDNIKAGGDRSGQARRGWNRRYEGR